MGMIINEKHDAWKHQFHLTIASQSGRIENTETWSDDGETRKYKELINVDGAEIIQIDRLIKHLFYEMIRHFYVYFFRCLHFCAYF